MFQLPIADIITKIKTSSKLEEREIKEKIKLKMEELSGLISEQGAAHIVANELGVKLFEAPTGTLKIKNILAGMRNVDTEGRVISVFPVRVFKTESREGKVGSFILGDETGTIRITLWNDMADKLSQVKENDCIRIKSAYVRENQGRKELHLGDRSALVVNPPDLKIEELNDKRKTIAELSDGDDRIELLGTVVQVFNPTYFYTCPTCRKSVGKSEEGACATHGTVSGELACVLNVLMDDGSGSIRVALFRNQAEKLIKDINEMKDQPEKFETAKADILGNIVKVAGRVKTNTLNNTIDFVARSVDPKPDAEEELRRVEKNG